MKTETWYFLGSRETPKVGSVVGVFEWNGEGLDSTDDQPIQATVIGIGRRKHDPVHYGVWLRLETEDERALRMGECEERK